MAITRLALAYRAADLSTRDAVKQTTHVEKKENNNAHKDKGKNMLAIDTIMMVMSLQCFY